MGGETFYRESVATSLVRYADDSRLGSTLRCFLYRHHTHVVRLLALLPPKSLAKTSATNGSRLHRSTPLLIPKLLLLGGPDRFGSTITASKTLVLVAQGRAVGIVTRLLVDIRFDAPAISPGNKVYASQEQVNS